MSSFSAKWLSLVLVVSTATICLLHQPVTGDEALIRTVCGWTPEVDACLSCLQAAVGSQSKDTTELAAISINCASSISNKVIQDFSGIAKGTGDTAVKEKCGNGEKIISDAENSLVAAMLDWSNGQFHSAGDKVANADDVYSACVKLAIPAPPAALGNDLSLLKKYYLNAKAILYKL